MPYVIIFFVAIISGMGFVGKWYYEDTQQTIAILQQNNAKLETAVQIQEEAMQSLQADYAKANEELQKVNKEFAQTRKQNNVLSDKLARHDLGLLGNSKPGLTQKVINKASEKAGRCFELLSGSELTETEKNATSAKAFNSECPWLWPGNVNGGSR